MPAELISLTLGSKMIGVLLRKLAKVRAQRAQELAAVDDLGDPILRNSLEAVRKGRQPFLEHVNPYTYTKTWDLLGLRQKTFASRVRVRFGFGPRNLA